MRPHRISFPKQPTVAYIDSLLKSVREVRQFESAFVQLDLSNTVEVSAILICFLCGLVDLAGERNNKVGIVLPRNKRVRGAIKAVQYMSKNPDPPHVQITEKLCQLRKIESYRPSDLDDMLEIISYNHTALTPGLRSDVRIILSELLTNALDHSGEKQCYACVGIWGRSRHLHISFLDFGVGIPKKLRTRYPHLGDDCHIIQSLLQKGLTTRKGIEGGRGYQIIQDILKHNKGRLHIFSGKAKAILRYDRGEFNFKKSRKEFTGTCVDFQVNLNGTGFYEVIGERFQEEVF